MMKYSTQIINTANHKLSTHQKKPRKNYTFKIGLLALCSIFSSAVNAEFAAGWKSGLNFTTGSGSFTQPVQNEQAGLFPGTNLKFRPGFVISAYENQSLSLTEARWQALFTSSQNRKQSYRPPGIYGGVMRRLDWSRFYVDENVRPTDPSDHTDAAYDWSLLDAIFTINAVQNEDALVYIDVREVSWGSPSTPNWLNNGTYQGVFEDGMGRDLPKYYRFAGPDNRGLTDIGASPNIVEEFVAFHQAMHDHLVKTGNIDKVMGIQLQEVFNSPDYPADWNKEDFFHGAGLRAKLIMGIWEKSQISVIQNSVAGDTMKRILWEYIGTSSLGMAFPDLKLTNTSNLSVSRFTHPDGTYQKDVRPLVEATEGNGVREFTYFSPGMESPWGYDDITKPQTASHVLWALSGPPKGENKDSGLGQSGDDPTGIMPVHTVILSWGSTSLSYAPTLEDWHKAIDTFGPPGTFAFPYLPQGL